MVVHQWERGTSRGTAFSHCLATEENVHEFPFVSKIEVWTNNKVVPARICAIRVQYTNNKASPTFGNSEGATKSDFTLRLGEYITELRQGESEMLATRCISCIYLATNQDRTWSSMSGSIGAIPTFYPVTIHSGFPLGISGRAEVNQTGAEITSLGYYFLEDIDRIRIDFEFLEDPNPENLSLIYYDTLKLENNTTIEQPGEVERDKSVTNSTSSEESWADEMGVNMSVKTGFFGIGETEMGAEWKVTRTETNTTSSEKGETIRWRASPRVPPLKRLDCDLLHFEGYFNVKYRSEVLLYGKSGGEYTIHKVGYMQGVTSSVTIIRYTERELNAPAAGLDHLVDRDIPLNKLPPNTEESTN
ncbi:uncharacterized protein N7503_004141 [Penicillium pulvis]|uniref:uncharacterized protein n=1 Tax=Penicillium pulvis TaxID=1562058 RepID=UPI0025479454|nr:uncharacterized protein N7503_004141 [Penicillium pulvis]KAJ5806539.1 hypothetical protein N7503_004141 [Penicillium pulvis]